MGLDNLFQVLLQCSILDDLIGGSKSHTSFENKIGIHGMALIWKNDKESYDEKRHGYAVEERSSGKVTKSRVPSVYRQIHWSKSQEISVRRN